MRFRLKRTSSDGDLPLIAEIPSHPVARLEGVNGVGKTVTIRILEICAGRRPDLTQDQWEGLCDGLGTVEVRADRTVGGQQVHWVLTGATLRARSEDSDAASASPTEPAAASSRNRLGARRRAVPAVDWFDSITIDGAPVAGLDQVRRLIAVERIGGEAGLVRTIASYAEEQGELAAQRLEDTLDFDLADSAARLLEEVEARLHPIDVDDLRERRAESERCARELRQVTEAGREAAAELQDLRVLVDLNTRIEQWTRSAPELDAQISKLSSSITSLEEEQASVDDRIRELESTVANTDALRKELKSADTTFKSQTTRMGNLAKDLAAARRLAGLDADGDATARASQLRRDLDAAIARRDALDARPALSGLIDRVLPDVQAREAAGHGSQLLVAVSDAGDDGLDVASTAAGLAWRREALRREAQVSEGSQLAAEIQSLRHALDACQTIPDLLKQFKGASEARSTAENRQREVTKRLAQPAAAELDTERIRRRELSDAIVEAAAERAVASQQRAGLGSSDELQAVERQLEAELLARGISRSELPRLASVASARVQAEQNALSEVQRLADAAQTAFARAAAELQSALDALRSGTFAWLAAGAVSVPAADDSLDARLALSAFPRRGFGRPQTRGPPAGATIASRCPTGDGGAPWGG